MWLKTGSSYLPKVKGKCGQYFYFKLPGCGWPPNHRLNVGSNAFQKFKLEPLRLKLKTPRSGRSSHSLKESMVVAFILLSYYPL